MMDQIRAASNGGVNQIPLPGYLQNRPGPEKYAYVLDHLHDGDGGGPEDHSADVTAIPWNKDYVAAIGTDRAAELAQVLADKQRAHPSQWMDSGPGVKTLDRGPQYDVEVGAPQIESAPQYNVSVGTPRIEDPKRKRSSAALASLKVP